MDYAFDQERITEAEVILYDQIVEHVAEKVRIDRVCDSLFVTFGDDDNPTLILEICRRKARVLAYSTDNADEEPDVHIVKTMSVAPLFQTQNKRNDSHKLISLSPRISEN